MINIVNKNAFVYHFYHRSLCFILNFNTCTLKAKFAAIENNNEFTHKIGIYINSYNPGQNVWDTKPNF